LLEAHQDFLEGKRVKMDFLDRAEENKREVISKLIEYEVPNIQEFSELVSITVSIDFGSGEETWLGKSRFGGTPDLPRSLEWPQYKGKFMTFFAQINFAEIPEHPELAILPEDGIFYFFVFLDSPGNEYFGSKSPSEVAVLFFNGSEDKLLQQDFPDTLPEQYRIEEIPIFYDLKYSVPCSEADLCLTDKEFDFTDELSDWMCDLSNEFNKFSAQILGFPTGICAEPVDGWSSDYQCAFLQNSNIHELPPSEGEERELRKGWVNLLSIDFMSFPLLEEISECKGYWGIRREDLQRLNFNRVCLDIQA
jgi:uncharacterized protein YwqG